MRNESRPNINRTFPPRREKEREKEEKKRKSRPNISITFKVGASLVERIVSVQFQLYYVSSLSLSLSSLRTIFYHSHKKTINQVSLPLYSAFSTDLFILYRHTCRSFVGDKKEKSTRIPYLPETHTCARENETTRASNARV